MKADDDDDGDGARVVKNFIFTSGFTGPYPTFWFDREDGPRQLARHVSMLIISSRPAKQIKLQHYSFIKQ